MGYVLNLVYDKWENDTPIPNGIEIEYLKYSLASTQIRSFQNINCIDRKIEDVIKFPDEKFFYVVWCRSSINYFIDRKRLPITNEVIDLIINNKNLNLIFLNECEFESRLTTKKLNTIIIKLGINPNQVWMINNNSKLYDFKKELDLSINTHITRKLCVCVSNENLNFKIKKDEGSFFLCHNRTPKIHRYGILCLLKKYNILDDVNWSILNGWYFDRNYSSLFLQNDIDYLQSEIDFFNTFEIYKSKYEKDYTEFDNRIDQIVFFEPKTYENSYFNITTESNYSSEDIHISEKSFKPFSYYQYPLILASYQHIKYFKKDYDLDFFDDVINHDYDNIKNDRDRLFKFIEEIKRINDNKEFFIDFYKKNQDRFIKNREKMLSYTHKYDYDFFEQLNKNKIK